MRFDLNHAASIATNTCDSQQLIVECGLDKVQLMVASNKSAFAEGLNSACDNAKLPQGRGRVAALHRLAHAAGLTVTTEAVRKWLAGETMPSQANLRLLAIGMKVDSDQLLTGRPAQATPDPPLSPRQRALLEMFESLPSDEQDSYYRALEGKKQHYDKVFEELSRRRKAM